MPSPIRDQDNLVFELMMPADLEVESHAKEAARILAPFLIISQTLVINLDDLAFKTGLLQVVPVLLQATMRFDYTKLREYEQEDLDNVVSGIMPKLIFVSSRTMAEIKKDNKLKGNLEDEVLEKAITKFFSNEERKQILSLFKKRHLLTPIFG